ncbi:3-hydroxylacyl-ACP dehydratase [Alkalilimnicola sp. S0819]|nr:3-hydroxylacyl-ACP dehydratase [Alkalilimnicola sp. S0819]MPQ16438.1 3-hydroxylacyl-ACP dehydratase [Alkalilimnicola sp. S0819]
MIPHAGRMCLLESVSRWDEDEIVCRTSSHRADSNPLRRDGRLHAVHGLEYGAQAMAIHGALRARAAGGAGLGGGYLAAARPLTLHCQRLDDLPGELEVRARHLFSSGGNLMYEFSLHHDERLLLEGRATVVEAAEDTP